MGRYCQLEQVRLRLVSKVRFAANNSTDENLMPYALANLLIEEAEGQLEYDLSPRYAIPLQTIAGTAFNNVPNGATKNIIKTLAELQSVIRILETDFGRGTAVDGDKYKEKLEKRYTEMCDRLVAKRKVGGEESMQWKSPPLPGLMLNYFNSEADDGYAGRIYVTDSGRGGFPAEQINSPGENFWSGSIEGLDDTSDSNFSG